MIHFVTTAEHAYTLKPFRLRPFGPVRVHSYDWLFRQNRIKGGRWVFTDIERLTPLELDAAAYAASLIERAGNEVWNHPARVKTRFELLTALRADGFQDFGVWRAALRPKPDRFPVLLKAEQDHANRFPDLIHSQPELDATLDRLMAEGVPLRHVLVITFANAELRPGVFQRHSVFRVGDHWFPGETDFEANWAVKYGSNGLATEAEIAAVIQELNENPNAARVAPAFDVAGIKYGRLDFALVGGRANVFEINTNPFMPRGTRKDRPSHLAAALNRVGRAVQEAVRDSALAGPPVALQWDGFRFMPSRHVPWRRLYRP